MLIAILLMMYGAQEPEKLGVFGDWIQSLMGMMLGDNGNKTLEEILKENPEVQTGWLADLLGIDMGEKIHNKMAEALGLSKEEFAQVLASGEDLLAILGEANPDLPNMTLNALQELEREEIHELFFNETTIPALLAHDTLGPLAFDFAITSGMIPAEMAPLLTDHNKALLQREFAKLSPEQSNQLIATLQEALTGDSPDLEAMAQIFQHEEMVAALKALIDEKNGIQIPAGTVINGIDVSAKAGSTLAFLRTEGNIEALAAFAPTLAGDKEFSQLLVTFSNSKGVEKIGALGALGEYLDHDVRCGEGETSRAFLEFHDNADLSALGIPEFPGMNKLRAAVTAQDAAKWAANGLSSIGIGSGDFSLFNCTPGNLPVNHEAAIMAPAP